MTRMALLAAAIACLASLPATAQGDDRRMRIVGRALVEVAPDFVTVRVGVSNRAPTPTAALDQNSVTARRIIDFAKGFGVQEREIQTDAVNLSPIFRTVREPGGATRQEPDGYAANNTVRVKLSDLSRLGTFMRQVLDQGATNISGVQFGIENSGKATDEALAKAVEDAVRQARRLAEAAQVKLGRIEEIAHPPRTQVQFPVPMAMAPRQASAVPVEAGALQVSAEVEITWALE